MIERVGVGPEQVQSLKAVLRTRIAMLTGVRAVAAQDPAALRFTSAPVTGSPHPIVRRPDVELAVTATAMGREGLPHLPGRVSPVAWDGEATAASPFAGDA